MSRLRPFVLALAGLSLTAALTGCTILKPSPAPDTAIKLGESWGSHLATRNPAKIAGQYAPDAVLFATFTDMITSPEGVEKYFAGLSKKPGLRVEFNTMISRTLAPNIVSLSGLYTFKYEEKGRTVRVPARYQFVWENRDGKWLLLEHHSSVRPEKKK